MHRIPLASICMIVALWSATASAQGPGTPQYAEAAPAAQDGARFRGGIALSAGLESVSDDFDNSVSGLMFGVDGRIGLQLNDLLGFYAQPHLSFGSLSSSGAGGVSGATGTFTIAAMAEVTLADRFFVGAGFGYGVLNNPSGPMFQARLGGYPLMGRGEGARRKGLMVGVDLRTVFVTGGTGILVLGSVGYEAF